ncbi:Glyoxalase-like domain-containing protein [Faunimonas pinastri]|uniref:Glyoxalase-like domain-containing protein n=1 Tax=Faunimonas pinastri TaxID=1855383 RepID=A0A1H9C0H5_9HYPH|nr:VOC family protein [Faunimonas pinastri]SEP94775.1 Glyoxalase-like domain-containing protein [Faunimonas pinastri]
MTMRLPIDHVVVLVPDLAAAGAAFEAAGFQVTPEARHSPQMGTANRCVMLAGSYIEIMGVVEPTAVNAGWRELLAAGIGIRGLAFRSTDIRATVERLQANGIAAEAVREFSRSTPDGQLRFSIARIAREETPGLQCLFCQHHTPQLLWRPNMLVHPNGASGLESVGLPSPDGLQCFGQDGEPGIAVSRGADRLVIRGEAEAHHDLRATCGIEIRTVRP